MKKIILATAMLLSNLYLIAQEKKQETIIVQDNKNNPTTTIEIINGEIKVDGKKVSTISDKSKSIKIIKKNNIDLGKVDESEIQDFSFPGDDIEMDKPIPNRRAMLGVSTKDVKDEEGALIEAVTPKSPAEKIGLIKGDIITKVNDKKITNPKDLVDAISSYEPGEKIQLTYLRNNKPQVKEVELSKNTMDSYSYRKTLPITPDEDGGFNMDFSDMFKPFMKQFNIDGNSISNNTPKIGLSVEDRADGDGVLVNDVKDKSAAADAGIQVKDVITKIENRDINNVDELSETLRANANKKELKIELKRNGALKTVVVALPKNLKKGEF